MKGKAPHRSRKGKKKQKKQSVSLSEILPTEAIELLKQLKKDIRREENRHKFTKQGIKRLDDVKKKKRTIIRRPK